MPEMPEVETLVRKLRGEIVGRRIVKVTLSGFRLRRPIANDFAEKLRGRTIKRLRRRGKYIIAELEPKSLWLMHLGMSGKILFHAGPRHRARHTHVQVRFSDCAELEYRDPRRFGLMAVYEGLALNQLPEIRDMGIEPLSAGFGGAWLQLHLHQSRQELKAFLLDQRKVAGLGNIYVCESLFLARLHPQRRCHTLTSGESIRLAKAIQKVLRISIRRRGTSFSDFVDSAGISGENQNYLKVYQREHEACPRCGSAISRIIQANRSSFFCPECQGLNTLQKD
jgi:formamidopyrimidine-DNA glycosylase